MVRRSSIAVADGFTGTMRQAGILLLLLAVSACTPRLESRTADLVNAKNLWLQTSSGSAYSFTVVRRCFCELDGVPVRVSVTDDAVLSSTGSQGESLTIEPHQRGFMTIPDYFNLILDLIELELNSGLELEVAYDQKSGYPSLIAWNDPGVMDSEVRIEISDYALK